jgi:hypothetical protein
MRLSEQKLIKSSFQIKTSVLMAQTTATRMQPVRTFLARLRVHVILASAAMA